MTPSRLLRLQALYLRFTAALFLVASVGATLAVANSAHLAASYQLDPVPLRVVFLLLALTLAFLAFVRYATLRTPVSPFSWRINAILLGLDLSTLLLWPLALPLLVYWLRPSTREFFSVSRETSPEAGT